MLLHFRSVRGRAFVIAVAALGVIIAVVFWRSLREPQPEYKGRPLEYWLGVYASSKDKRQAQGAIRDIGTNAFPLLLQWIREPEPERSPAIANVMAKLPDVFRPKWARSDYFEPSFLAAYAFKALGTQASPIVPELSAIGSDPTNRDGAIWALRALSYMGSNGVPALLTALRSPSHPYRDTAAVELGESKDLGPYTNVVVGELLARLDDPGIISLSAVRALRRLKACPELVVPALARCLENTNATLRSAAAGSLSFFDESAIPALPSLTNALNDPEPAVRATAYFAIRQIHLELRRK